jgi:UDP-N-acetylmuramyl pentapeptide phosphotransferase/UDP-N-acetylglucosamine-1-phosphate transferase
LTPREQLPPLSLDPCTKLLLLISFSGPYTQAELQSFRDDLADRFKGDWEKAVEYVNKSNDRFISKAGGLLAFNGLVLTALAIWPHSQMTIVGSICAIASASILLVTHFIVNVGHLDDYKEAKLDFSAYVVEIVRRAKYILVAAVLSLASVLVPLVAVLFHFCSATAATAPS